MKFNFKYMMMLAVTGLAIGATSCDDEGLDDIQGIYNAPKEYKITKADVVSKSDKGEFVVDFTTTSGTNVHMVLLCDKYFIASDVYSYAKEGVAKSGNFTDGTTIDGKPIVGGSFSLTKNEDQYTINTSALMDADGVYHRVKGAVEMVFVKAKPVALVQFGGANFNAEAGTLTVAFNTGTYTESFNMQTYQTTYEGTGKELKIVFNSTDGKLYDGTYKAGTGYVAGFTNRTYEAYGYIFDDGSLWGNVADGAKTSTHIVDGDIVVAREGSHYVITIDNNSDGIYAEFEGDLPTLMPLSENVIMMNNALDCVNWAMYNMAEAVTIPLVKGEIKMVTDAEGKSSLAVVNGTVLNLQVYAKMGEGIVYTGVYEMGKGLTAGSYMDGIGNIGCYLLEYKDGAFAGAPTYLSSGKLEVSLSETGETTLRFTLGSDVYSYTGVFDFVKASESK